MTIIIAKAEFFPNFNMFKLQPLKLPPDHVPIIVCVVEITEKLAMLQCF